MGAGEATSANDRTVDVRIQDRGPFVRGRIIDLSHAAAREIELIGPGITKVKLTVIAPPKKLDEATRILCGSGRRFHGS